jgi:hypothetical protein
MTLRPMAIPTALELVRDDGQVSHRRRKVAGVGRGLAVRGSQDVRDGDRPEIPDPPAQPTDDQDPNPDARPQARRPVPVGRAPRRLATGAAQHIPPAILHTNILTIRSLYAYRSCIERRRHEM